MKHIAALTLLLSLGLTAALAAPPKPVFPDFTSAWRDDPAWHDGKAEMAYYDATHVIYGKPRAYIARAMTNKEHASAETKTKSATGDGRPVFKFHMRDDVPTAKYTYHFSTMVYVGIDDLKSLKIDMGSQEDCGATYKQIVNHAGTLTHTQHSYFPGEGHRAGKYRPPSDLVFHDALPLVLRGYPFDAPRDVPIQLLPEQTDTHLTPVRPESYIIHYVGRETLDLPVGETEAHHLELRFAGPTREMRPPIKLWFAADGSAPMLHAMVQYEDPRGTTYKLRELKREAYWR